MSLHDEVLKMDLKSIHAAVKAPETKKEMQALLSHRDIAQHVSNLMLEAQQKEAELDAQLNRVVPPSTEELAAQAAEMAAAPAETPAEVPPAPPVVAPVERTKIVREYQVRDEDGNPIGRPTHLEAWSMDELLEKMQTAHESATRAFHRLKKQKLTFKQEQKTALTPEQIAAAAEAALSEKDPKKAQDVVRDILRNEFQKEEMTLQQKRDFQTGLTIANDFRARHLHDYNPCEANQKLMTEYLKENNLDLTLDNVEAAFEDLLEQGSLVPVKRRAEEKAPVVANPTPVAAVVATPAQELPVVPVAAAVSASIQTPPQAQVVPVVETTVTTPAAAHNAQPAARRPGVGGSIVPGSLSAERPGTPDPALARKEFLKTVRDMKPDVMRAKLKNDPQFVSQLKAYGIQVR